MRYFLAGSPEDAVAAARFASELRKSGFDVAPSYRALKILGELESAAAQASSSSAQLLLLSRSSSTFLDSPERLHELLSLRRGGEPCVRATYLEEEDAPSAELLRVAKFDGALPSKWFAVRLGKAPSWSDRSSVLRPEITDRMVRDVSRRIGAWQRRGAFLLLFLLVGILPMLKDSRWIGVAAWLLPVLILVELVACWFDRWKRRTDHILGHTGRRVGWLLTHRRDAARDHSTPPERWLRWTGLAAAIGGCVILVAVGAGTEWRKGSTVGAWGFGAGFGLLGVAVAAFAGANRLRRRRHLRDAASSGRAGAR